ncbi:hypothetical protein BKA61DRAFT_719826 [Leptodontidium sp. MPI-SDFR-AT-0119]|nr:hypothetical protein BKA61DRAFT_719826 [Leptodontidium sp. MPI-SDFR-AT-0119]
MPPQLCPTCNRPPLSTTDTEDSTLTPTKCPLCNAITYCSFDCYTFDSNTHTILCNAYSTFTSKNPRPLTFHKLSLLLPSSAANPEFIWLKTCLHAGNWESAILEDHLGPDHPESRTFSITRELSAAHPDEKRYKNLNRTLFLECRADFEDDGSMRNWCVEKLIDEKLAKQWKGPMVISSKSESASNPALYEDFYIGDIALGVRIHCLGEKNVSKKPAFSAIAIEKDHDIFIMDGRVERIIPVTQSMGIPILIYNTGNVNYADQDLTEFQKRAVEGDIHFTKNPAVMFLTLDTDVKSQNWGAPDKMQWGDDTGNVIVARVDRKPLSPRQVEALVCYCRDVLHPAMKKTSKDFGGQNASKRMKAKEEVVTKLTRQARFKIYFNYLKSMKQIADSSWAKEKSPFT